MTRPGNQKSGPPAGRLAEPTDLVGPCLFLISQASLMVTGHVLFVDGGFMAQ
jgi:NAD(P)-dependent dehydrogenase (short-subunit alcohol dehydrogenase family)